MRFALQEVDSARVRDALTRRVVDLPHRALWRLSQPAQDNRRRLQALRERHAGQRCVIMGNGPSLARMDLAPLASEHTFGLNRIYLLYDKLPFRPTFYACTNELVLEQFHGEIAALGGVKFVNWNRRQLFGPDPSLCFVRTALSLVDFFGSDVTRAICAGGTITYVALQIAFHLGFRRVILVGVDHRFVERGTPNRAEVRTQERDESHFHPDYFPKGSRWQLPDLVRSEHAYRLARKAYERAGGQIIDATLDGQCQVFEKRSLAEALAQR